MRAHRRAHRLRRVRRAILVGIGVLLLVLLGLFLIGRRGMESPERARDQQGVPLRSDTITYEARGFHHLVSVGDRPLFRIEAQRSTAATSGKPRLEEVEITWFAPDGETYSISSQRGIFNLKTREARLEGDVSLTGPDGFNLRTSSLQLSPRARWVRSHGGVQLAWGDRYHGQAGRLRAQLNKNVFRLEKGVVISGRDEQGQRLALRARNIQFDRDQHLLIAQGEVRLRLGESLMNAPRLVMQLDQENRDPRSLTARGGVTGVLDTEATTSSQPTREAEGEGMPSRATHFRGEELLVKYAAGGSAIQMARLQAGAAEEAVTLEMQEEGVTRRLRAPSIRANFEVGQLTQIQTSGATTVVTTVSEAQASSETAQRVIDSSPVRAGFSRGELQSVHFAGPVQIHSERGQARGSSARFDALREVVHLFGSPALADTEQGSLWAPHIVWDLTSEELHASQGVRARLHEDTGLDLPAARESPDEEPIQVEAKSATWKQKQGRYRFSGEVRAWQGQSYLLAESLRGAMEPQTLVAEGEVSMRWLPPPEADDAPAKPAAATQPQNNTTRDPIEVSGTKLAIDRSAGTITVAGPASLRQGQRHMECERIEGILNEEGRVETLDCLGLKRIVDPTSGRTVSGEVAHYDAESGLIRVEGDPVVLRSADGSTIRGSLLEYDLADGSAEVLGGATISPGITESGAAETLLRPGRAGRTDRDVTSTDEEGDAPVGSAPGEAPAEPDQPNASVEPPR